MCQWILVVNLNMFQSTRSLKNDTEWTERLFNILKWTWDWNLWREPLKRIYNIFPSPWGFEFCCQLSGGWWFVDKFSFVSRTHSRHLSRAGWYSAGSLVDSQSDYRATKVMKTKESTHGAQERRTKVNLWFPSLWWFK